jgi:hypothetical protein
MNKRRHYDSDSAKKKEKVTEAKIAVKQQNRAFQKWSENKKYSN